jgi:hypothetical protein
MTVAGGPASVACDYRVGVRPPECDGVSDAQVAST